MRGLLIVHGVLAFALLGSTIHHTAACLPWLWQRSGSPRLVKMHVSLTLILAIVVFLIGLTLYPSYKVEVRVEAFDVPRAAGGLGLSWVSHLFDIKEHLAALAIPGAVGLYALHRSHGIAELLERRLLYVGLSMLVTAAVATATVIALYVVTFKAVS